MSELRILVTNDDGIMSDGIHILGEALKKLGNVCIVAPEKEQNATGHSLTLHKPLRVKQRSEFCYAVSGTPTDCVSIAVHNLYPKPDILISGINRGGNLGDDVTYSGTVSAAMEGTLLGIPSIAVSMLGDDNYHFETAANFIAKLAVIVSHNGLPLDTLLNVNVPNLTEDKIKGVKFTCMGKRVYTENMVVKKIDPRGRPYYWVGGENVVWQKMENSDYEAVSSNFISITPLNLNLTDNQTLRNIMEWEKDL